MATVQEPLTHSHEMTTLLAALAALAKGRTGVRLPLEWTGVAGKVWSWRYSRPQPGAEPVVSYGVGPDGPSTQVWLDRAGKVAAVVSGECKPGTQWCPT